MVKKMLALALSIAMMCSTLQIVGFAATPDPANTEAFEFKGTTVTVNREASGFTASDYNADKAAAGVNQMNYQVAPQTFREVNNGSTVSRDTEKSPATNIALSNGVWQMRTDPAQIATRNNDYNPFDTDAEGNITAVYGRDSEGFFKVSVDSTGEAVQKERQETWKYRYVMLYKFDGLINNISDIVIGGSASSNVQTGSYDVYVTDNYNELYTDKSLVYSYNDDDGKGATQYQSFNFGKGINARYLAVVMYSTIKTDAKSDVYGKLINDSKAKYWFQDRVCNFLIYGNSENTLQADESAAMLDKTAVTVSDADIKSYVKQGDLWVENSTVETKRKDVVPNLRDGKTQEWRSSAKPLYNFINPNSTGGSDKYFTDGKNFFYQLTYVLSDKTDITDILVLNSAQKNIRTGYYDVFVSDNIGDLFSEASKVFTCVNYGVQTRRQVLSFTEPKAARFVAIRVYDPYSVDDPAAMNATDGLATDVNRYIRLQEFNVYGTINSDYSYTGSDYAQSDISKAAGEYKTAMGDKVTNNLLTNNLVYSQVIANGDKITPLNDNTLGKIADITTNDVDNIDRSGGNNRYDLDGYRIFGETTDTGLKDSNNNTIYMLSVSDDATKNSMELHYKLDGEATLSELDYTYFGASYWNAGHVLFSFANTEEELFSDTAYNANIYNSNQRINLKLPDGVTARYVGVRIIAGMSILHDGTTIGYQGGAGGYYYVRLSHINLTGTFTETASGNVTAKNDVTGEAIEAAAAVAVEGATTDNNGAYAAGSKTQKVTAPESLNKDNKEYIFSGWYDGKDLLSKTATYDVPVLSTDREVVAKYEANAVTYTVTFTDKVGNTIAAVTANEGDTLANVIAANSITAPAIYGYTFKGWNVDTAQAVTDNITVQATYEKNTETKYTVTVTDTAGNVTTSENLVFDQKIVLTDAEGKTAAWEVDGKVVGYGTSVTLYVCGNMNVKAIAEATEADAVVNLGVVAESGSFTVFGRVVSTKNISKVGVIFASKTAYNGGLKDSTDWLTDVKNLPDNYYKMTEIANPTAGDFMSTLTNVKTGATRYAVSYAVLEDGTVLYGDVAEKTF